MFIRKDKMSGGLTKEEYREVDHFVILEHIISLAKARALKKL
jgi:hypothetical protein